MPKLPEGVEYSELTQAGPAGPRNVKVTYFYCSRNALLQKETALNIAQCVRGRTFPLEGKLCSLPQASGFVCASARAMVYLI